MFDTPEFNSIRKTLGPEDHCLYTVENDGVKTLLVTGGDGAGVLHAAYRLAELLGIRFNLRGDVIPDERIPVSVPTVRELNERRFEIRGTLPFHDFPQGPDWWNFREYETYISQLAKLRLNFIGLHTYPDNRQNPEPAVWVGLREDIRHDGSVLSSYKTSYYNTMNGMWGFHPMETGEFICGTAELFSQ